jgi:hypothetical protein
MIPDAIEGLKTDVPHLLTAVTPRVLTIAQAEKLIVDPVAGLYPHRSPFRDELVRSLRFACVVWGPDRSWESIAESDWVRLLQRRLDVLLGKDTKGIRAAQITVSRLITVVRWLRRTQGLSRDAAQWPEKWKGEIVKYWEGVTQSVHDPELVATPGFTVAEAQRILQECNFDPRFELLMWLGMGLSLGAVARARRKDLQLPQVDWMTRDDGTRSYGTVTLFGHFKKGRVEVALTGAQRVAIDRAFGDGGYLHTVEQRYNAGALKNYRLFPSGYVVGRVALLRGKESKLALANTVDFTRPVTSSWVRKNFRLAEKLAGVKHIAGRGAFRLPLVVSSRLQVDDAREAAVRPEDAPPDFAPLRTDLAMSEMLQQRWAECVLCVRANAHLAATVMMGGLLEALLFSRALRLQPKAPLFEAKSTPINPDTGKPLELSKWTLASYIDVAHELRWITQSAKDIAVVLRDYRNYVHPSKQWAHAMRLEVKDSQMFWDLTKHLAHQLLESANAAGGN